MSVSNVGNEYYTSTSTTYTVTTTTTGSTGAGSGVNGTTTAVPDSGGSAAAGAAQLFLNALAHLGTMLSSLGSTDTETLVREIMAAMDEASKENAEVSIEATTAQQQAEAAKRAEENEKALKAQEKADNKSRGNGLFAKVSSYMGVAASVISVGALAFAAGPGIVAAAGLIATLAVTDLILKETTGMGIGGHIGKEIAGDEGAKWGDLAFTAALLLASVALGFGAASASSSVAMISVGAKTADAVKTATLVLVASTSLMQAGSTADTTAHGYEADMAQSEAKKQAADASEYAAETAFTEEYMQLLLDTLKKVGEIMAAVLESLAAEKDDDGRTLAGVKF
ncbi:MAG: hypothetical protein ACOYJQ_13280 [Pseudochelatococcus sp.]|jgi:hypothetical protein|uniref:hypothetical protein n=1 Tax=Pseudochelatococcus sp. TaxID=2020869 RepID=UPI003D8D841B